MTRQHKAHIHKFIKINGKNVKAWRCAAGADCSYILHSGQQELLMGRTSICWNCGAEFKIHEDNLEQEMPTCTKCRMESQGIDILELLKVIK